MLRFPPAALLPPLCGALCSGLLLCAAPIARAQTAASVTVQAGSALSTIPAPAFGVNTAAWDAYLLDGSVPGLLKQAGVKTLRFPGGSVTDVYHWQTNTASQGQYINPNNTFDAFMGVVTQTGAEALLCVNYGTNTAGNAGGDPGEAAGWVAYANKTKGYGVKYWEVGNEVYGNGEYGSAFETDLHSDHSPTAYGSNVVQYVNAMKAQDSTIKVGAVLCAPGHFPDGQSPDWNSNVLAQCGGVIDFVIVHWYPQEPGSESDSFILDAPASQISDMVAKLRALINQYCGSRAAGVQILVTETNSVTYNPGKQTVSTVNALFIADDYATWLENGATNVDIWTLHNGPNYGNSSSSLYGNTSYGDYGILSSGQDSEPAVDTPFPSYYGIRMVSLLGAAGDHYVSASSNQSLLGVHAVKQADGDLAVLLINKDPAHSYAASVTVSGFTPASGSTDYFYGENSGSISSATGAAGATFSRTVPPYSLTTVVLKPNGTTAAAPVITSATTATATEGVAFSYQITATNNPTSFGVQGLPPGLTVDSKTGLISGTSKGAGTVQLALNAYNAKGKGSATLTLSVKAAISVVTSAKTASGTVGTAFSYQITATNGPTKFGVQGMPGWMSVNTSTGLISGTPVAAGTVNLTLNAYNAAGKGSEALTLTVAR